MAFKERETSMKMYKRFYQFRSGSQQSWFYACEDTVRHLGDWFGSCHWAIGPIIEAHDHAACDEDFQCDGCASEHGPND